MHLYDVAKQFSTGRTTAHRYICAYSPVEAKRIYRVFMQLHSQYDIYCKEVQTQGMILGHKDRPTIVVQSFKLKSQDLSCEE